MACLKDAQDEVSPFNLVSEVTVPPVQSARFLDDEKDGAAWLVFVLHYVQHACDFGRCGSRPSRVIKTPCMRAKRYMEANDVRTIKNGMKQRLTDTDIPRVASQVLSSEQFQDVELVTLFIRRKQ